VLPQRRIDSSKVAAALGAHLPAAFDGALHLRQFQGGPSNPTYHLATTVGDYVLRKKPPGQLLPSAHAVGREIGRAGAGAWRGIRSDRRTGLDAGAALRTVVTLRAAAGRRAAPG